MVSAVPKGFSTVTPHLVCRDAAAAIDFYRKAFGAEELSRMPGPDGRLVHAEIRIGDSIVMLTDEFRDQGAYSPASLGGSPASLMIYVADVDAAYARAVAAGAAVTAPLANMFWGDRYAKLQCPFGHSWAIATHVEDVAPDEMEARAKKAFA